MHEHAAKKNNKRRLRSITEEETSMIGNESDQSETSIYRIEKMYRITDKNKYLTTSVKINGTEKEFNIDTGSPISIMPVDDNMNKKTELHNVIRRYQDVNNNEVKFRRHIPVDVEYEDNKQKMQILITERNDITTLLGMDWLKKFNLTIRSIRLNENNQSEKN